MPLQQDLSEFSFLVHWCSFFCSTYTVSTVSQVFFVELLFLRLMQYLLLLLTAHCFCNAIYFIITFVYKLYMYVLSFEWVILCHMYMCLNTCKTLIKEKIFCTVKPVRVTCPALTLLKIASFFSYLCMGATCTCILTVCEVVKHRTCYAL